MQWKGCPLHEFYLEADFGAHPRAWRWGRRSRLAPIRAGSGRWSRCTASGPCAGHTNIVLMPSISTMADEHRNGTPAGYLLQTSVLAGQQMCGHG